MGPDLVVFCILASLAGCALGTFTGLVPGIHVNTLAAMFLAMYPSLEALVPLDGMGTETTIACCIMAASVVHSYVDFVPSAFIGAPDAEDAVSVLPGHRLLLEGRGMEAVRAAAIGSLIGCSAAILLSAPLQFILTSGAEDVLDRLTPLVLILAVVVILIGEWRNGSGIWGPVLFTVAGFLGLGCMVLPIQMDGILGEGSIMMPLLTGLFGIPVMLESSERSNIPPQTDRVKDPVGAIPGLKGVFMGTVAGWFPGITATVGASMSAMIFPEKGAARFISVVASIGTATSVLSLVTLSVSGNGRSGTSLVIGDLLGDSLDGLLSEPFVLLLLATAISSMMGYWLTIGCGKIMTRVVGGVNQRKLNLMVLMLLLILTPLLNGAGSLLILACSTAVGMLPNEFNTGRTVLCGCLVLPVLLFEFGLFRSIQLRGCLGHELRIVHYEPLVGPGTDLTLGILDDHGEYESPAVDLDEFGLTCDLHTQGCGGGMRHIEVRTDGAVPLIEMGRDTETGGGLDQCDHRRCGEYGQGTTAECKGRVLFGDQDASGSFDAVTEHIRVMEAPF